MNLRAYGVPVPHVGFQRWLRLPVFLGSGVHNGERMPRILGMSRKIGMTHEIALRLRLERERLEFSQKDFAAKIGVTRETMRKWENGLSAPTAEALAIAHAMGMDILYVVTGENRSGTPRAEKQTINIGSVQGVGAATEGSTVINTFKNMQKTIAEVKPGELHITDEQAATLQRLVDDIVNLEKKLKKKPSSHRAVWGTLNRFCKAPSYRLIKIDDFKKARQYLDMWIGRLNSMSSAPVKDGDNWRKRKYAYIHVNAKEQADKDALLKYIKKYGATSISQLSNEQLEETYRYVAGRRSK